MMIICGGIPLISKPWVTNPGLTLITYFMRFCWSLCSSSGLNAAGWNNETPPKILRPCWRTGLKTEIRAVSPNLDPPFPPHGFSWFFGDPMGKEGPTTFPIFPIFPATRPRWHCFCSNWREAYNFWTPPQPPVGTCLGVLGGGDTLQPHSYGKSPGRVAHL